MDSNITYQVHSMSYPITNTALRQFARTYRPPDHFGSLQRNSTHLLAGEMCHGAVRFPQIVGDLESNRRPDVRLTVASER